MSFGERGVTTKNDFEVEIRDGTPDDLGYVIDTLENSLRHRYMEADRKDFSNSCRALLAREMRNGASLYIACCPDVPTEIWGWSLTHDAAEVIFVYVRHKYRSQGIATGLLRWAGFDQDDEITVRHMTVDAANIKYGKRKKFRYIPYL